MNISLRNVRFFLSCLITFITIVIVQQVIFAAPVASPPSNIQVTMYVLDENGQVVRSNDTPESCGNPTYQSSFGCTAFDIGQTLSLQKTPERAVTIVPYPYANAAAPTLPFQNHYLKNVLPQEMGPDFDSIALQSQAIAARSIGMHFSGSLDNSKQVFVPYRFEFLRVEDGDSGYDPSAVSTPDISNCSSISGD